MSTWGPLQLNMHDDHAVVRQYPKLTVKMHCKRCHEDISRSCADVFVPVSCLACGESRQCWQHAASHASRLPSWQWFFKAPPGSSKQTAIAPCTY